MGNDGGGNYALNGRDRALLASAGSLLRKLARAEMLRPAEMVSVAKVLHVLSRLPHVTTELDVPVSVTSPRRHFDEIETYHWWVIAVEDERLSITVGGHFYRPSTGGDTFTTMTWEAIPEEPSDFSDYRESLGIVPDVQSFSDAVTGIDFAAAEYQVEITDPENQLLEDLDDSDEELDAEADAYG